MMVLKGLTRERMQVAQELATAASSMIADAAKDMNMRVCGVLAVWALAARLKLVGFAAA
jgi:hypothetical protein